MALFYACDVGTLDVVEFLISQRSDINAKDHVSIWMYIYIHANIKVNELYMKITISNNFTTYFHFVEFFAVVTIYSYRLVPHLWCTLVIKDT